VPSDVDNGFALPQSLRFRSGVKLGRTQVNQISSEMSSTADIRVGLRVGILCINKLKAKLFWKTNICSMVQNNWGMSRGSVLVLDRDKPGQAHGVFASN
jgi:hypothetical protein